MNRPTALVQRPVPLTVAVALVCLQGVAMMVFGVLELVHTSADNLGMAATTSAFFVLVGVGLLVAARGLAGLNSWARGPIVAAELIDLLTAYSFVGQDTTLVAVALAVVGLVALVCVLHPASTRALARDAD